MKALSTLTLSPVLFIIAALLCAALSLANLKTLPKALPPEVERKREIAYIPSGKGLELISFGYRNAVADILWLNTLSYFGKHFASDKNYDWLSHMCGLITRLNPKVFDPYYFCATMLGWEVNEPQKAIDILTSATEAHPDDWFFFYQRGFYRLYFLKDGEGAIKDFTEASHRPNAHPVAARLAAKKISDLDNPDTAIRFLLDTIRRTSDPDQRTAFEERLKELYYERDLQAIEQGIRYFEANAGHAASSLEELIKSGIYTGPVTDPFGGSYGISPDGSKAISSSGKKRVSLYGAKIK
jgi:hypothetical protein